MRTLLHVSDVHFGPPHLPRVAAGVLELIAERRPEVVVISGDLTQRAKPAQFHQARAWVDRIPAPVVVVPGNHDVPMYRVWERIFAPFGAYRRHFSAELEPVYRDDSLSIVGVNTAFNWTIDGGRITPARLRAVGEQLAAVPDGVFKVVVAHHHVIPPPPSDTRAPLANAHEALDLFSTAGVDLVLSGHLHQTFVGNSEEFPPTGGPPVVIVHSGTTTSDRGRGPERGRQSCNWIEFDDRSLAVSHLFWHDPSGRFVEHGRHDFPRRQRAPR